MGFLSLFVLAVGLSMDAFAVSICKGLAMQKLNIRKALIVGFWFGTFQAVMPMTGYYLGYYFRDKITTFDHWIAFGLLTFIGVNMIREAFSKEEEKQSDSLAFREMLLLAVATSIDALAAGITMAFLQVNIWAAILFIGITTLVLSMLGVWIGHLFGARYKSRAELAGGVILILLGIQILIEHLFM